MLGGLQSSVLVLAGPPASTCHNPARAPARPPAGPPPARLQACQQATQAAEQEDAWMDKVAPAPIYRPSEEQWRDPLAYIRSIQAEAAQFGICIVRAPLAPTVPGGLVSGQQPAWE